MRNVWATLFGILCLCLILSIPHPAFGWIEKPLLHTNLNEKEVRFGLIGGYQKNRKNYDSTGTKIDMSGDNSFQSVRGVLFIEYGIMSKATVFADISGIQNQAKALNTTTGGALTNTETGLSDADFGLRFKLYEDTLRVTLEGIAQFPLYSRPSTDSWNRYTSETPLPRGNGATELSILANLEYPLIPTTPYSDSELSLGTLFGATLRSASFSNTLPYKLYFKYTRNKSFFGSVGIYGQATLSNDKFSSQLPTIARDRATVSIAGSTLYNAINPTFLKAEAILGSYLSKNFFVSAGIQYPFSGKMVPVEPLALIALGLSFGGDSKDSVDSRTKSRPGPLGFQEYYLPSRVIQANNTLKLILIDKGRADGIIVGELLDIFEPNHTDGAFGAAIGRGRVLEVGPTRSKLQVLDYFKQGPDGGNPRIEEGFVVRRPLR